MSDLTEYAKAYHEQGQDRLSSYFAEHFGVHHTMVSEFGLGFVEEPLIEAHERFRGMAVFPYFSVQGTVTWLRAGLYEWEAQPGQTTMEETVVGHDFPVSTVSHHVYNVRHALPGMRTSKVWLVDDIRSVHLLRQAGERACAVPSWDLWRPAWGELFGSSEVILAYDRTLEELVTPIRQQFRRLKTRVAPVVLDRGDSVAGRMTQGETPESISGLDQHGQVG